MEASTQGILVVDHMGKIVLANAGAENIFGYARQELIGQPVELLVPEKFRKRHETDRQQYFHEPRNRPMGRGSELVGRRKDGSEFPAEVTLSHVPSPDGPTVTVFVTDITERKLYDELRASENRLQRVLETDAVGILFFDKSGTVTKANDAFLRMTGFTSSDVEGRQISWRSLTAPEWQHGAERQMEKLAATGRIGPYETQYVLKDGTRRWMVVTGRDLGDGTFVEYVIDSGSRKIR